MNREERQIVLHYLHNALEQHASAKRKKDLLGWVNDYSVDLFNVEIDSQYEQKTAATGKSDQEQQHGENHITSVKYTILKNLSAASRTAGVLPTSGKGYRLVGRIVDSFGITGAEREILRIFVNAARISALETLLVAIDEIRSDSFARRQFPSLGALLNLPVGEVERCFLKNSPLIAKGLFEYGYQSSICMSGSMHSLINTPCRPGRDVKNIVLGKRSGATLSSGHFTHMADEYVYLARLLGTAVKHREKGINILIYGPPGTGKTELAKTLCAEINADLYPVSENSDQSNREARLSELKMAKSLVSGDSNAVLLMDEAEDIFFRNFLGEGHGKLYINRLLEKNSTPVIWISNDLDLMDTAYIRRFSYALCMETPPARARAHIWKSELTKNKISMSNAEIENLAQNYALPPSFVASAIRSARIVRDKTAIERTLQSLEYAITGKAKLKRDVKQSIFNPALLNTDTDLEKLTERVLRGQMTRFSLCLFGASGTGKSEYARHLADSMGLDVLHKRASDLQSMWLGGTEKNIAAAFNEACKEKKLLIFDEADSFLRDRNLAERSWEISQVNEMLTWMESHAYPFVCTTNLMDRLDKASLRRFTFKVKFDYLKPAQTKLAFMHFFGKEYAPSLQALTPGDFSVVKNKAAILGVDDPVELTAMLAQEQEAKGVLKKHCIGF
jgi:SpoVK/Ycf46/Vps4 family AAA+-type ATPase